MTWTLTNLDFHMTLVFKQVSVEYRQIEVEVRLNMTFYPFYPDLDAVTLKLETQGGHILAEAKFLVISLSLQDIPE